MRHLLIMDAGAGLFGAKAPSPQPTILGAAILVIALIVAIVVGWWNWREAHEEEVSDSPEDLLASFEAAHEAGDIDDDELNRLRAKLTGNSPPNSPRKVEPPNEPPR
jgi:hypothetical protein